MWDAVAVHSRGISYKDAFAEIVFDDDILDAGVVAKLDPHSLQCVVDTMQVSTRDIVVAIAFGTIVYRLVMALAWVMSLQWSPWSSRAVSAPLSLLAKFRFPATETLVRRDAVRLCDY